MTDTGQVPGEGLPENAGMVEQPGVPAPGAYTYLSESPAEDEDLLLLPGAQGAWGNEVAPPAPAPVVEAVHEPGPHETSGRDSGSVDLGAVRMSSSAPQPPVARRPLHLGPPIPDGAGSPVRSLADRGPAGAPAAPFPARQAGPPATGPEYLDVPRDGIALQGAAPWGANANANANANGSGSGPSHANGLSNGHANGNAVAHGRTEAPAPVRVAPPVAQVATPGMAAETVFPEAGDAMAPAGSPEGAGSAQVAQAPDAQDGSSMAGAPSAEQPAGIPEAQDAPGADGFPDAAPATAHTPAPGPGPAEASDAAHAPVPDTAPAQTVGTVPGPAVVDPAEDAGPATGAGPVPEGVQVPEGLQVPEPGQVPEIGQVAETGQVAGAGQVPEGAPGPEDAPASRQPEAEESALGRPADTAGAPEAQAAPVAAEAAPAPQAVPVQDYAQAPRLADGSLFPQAPEEGQGPEFAQVVPDFAQVPEPTSFPAAPDAVPFAAPPGEAGQHPPEGQPEGQYVPHAGDVAHPGYPVPDAEPAHPQEAQAQDTAVPVADAGPPGHAEHQEPRPQEPSLLEPPHQEFPHPHVAEAEAVPAASVRAEPGQVQEAPEVSPGAAEAAVRPAEPAEGSAWDACAPDVARTAPAADTAERSAPHLDDAHGAAPHAEAVPHQDVPPADEQAAGGSVPVEDMVPAGPHLVPTPPHGVIVQPFPAEQTEQAAEGTTDPAGAPAGPPEPDPQPEAASGPQPEAAPVAAPEEEPLLVLPAPREPEPDPVSEAGFEAASGAAAVAVPDPRAEAAEPVAGPGTGAAPAPVPVPNAPVEDDAPEPVAAQRAAGPDTGAPGEQEGTAAVAEPRRSVGPAAPGYDDAERETVLRVMRERRDIRNGFRSDPIPHDVLLRVLEAAHTAPSVGHSQPWDFVVIRSAETRRAMHELAARQREAYANSLPKGRAKQFRELKIEAILDTPVNIVVTADPTRGGRHTLGRHTQPQMAPYSSALAVENLWLAARAEGLGVGWVSFFDEREMVRGLGLPEHLEVVAYLCVGYVDEFPEEPELLQAGWSKRRPLSWVVHEETYGRRALPGEAPHDLLAETITNIRPLDAKALGEAWERQKRMTKPSGALGMLEIISAQLSGLSRMCPPPIPEPAAVAIFAGDHGVHAQGVTPWPQEVTGQMVANILGGGAVCNAFATQVGAEVCVVDVGVASDLPATPGLLPRKVRAGTADMTTGPALTREEVRAAVEVGIETARDLVAAGNKALITGEMGIANTTASAALIAVFTDSDPAEVTGRGTGINDETLARKTEVVRRALELHQPDPADPIGVLAAIGGLEHAAMVGLLLGGASLRTPVILDGVSAGAAALVARAIAPEVLAACIAGHRSAEPGHVAALNKLGLRPLIDLDLRLGEGTGALLALPVVQSAARAMHEVATFDSAGVTEK